MVGMGAAIRRARSRSTPVTAGLVLAAVLAVALRLDLSGAGLDTGIPAALVLVVLAALAKLVTLAVAPGFGAAGKAVPIAGPFVVAASLVGGPLVGVCAAASTGLGAGALQGFAVGLVGEQLSHRGASGAVVLASLGLLTGFALSGPAASWRTSLLLWMLPVPLL